MKFFVYTLVILSFCQACKNDSSYYGITDTLYNKLSKLPDTLLTDVSFSFLQKSYKLPSENYLIIDSISITNTGLKTLKIERIIQSCECTTLGVNSFILRPGQKNTIVYKIDGKKLSKGYNSSILTVYGNFFPYFRNIQLETFKP